MTDLNEIKAGEYELVALFWEEITSQPGQPFNFVRHGRGETVSLDVEDARRLFLAGAVRKPGKDGELEVPGSEESTAPKGPVEGTFGVQEPAGGSDGATSEASEPPAKSADKATWVGYAISQGADADEADASTKDELITAYGG